MFTITNTGPAEVLLTEISVEWPVAPNTRILNVTMNGKELQNLNTSTSPLTIDLFGVNPNKKRVFPGDNLFEFIFKDGPAPTGYAVTVTFDLPGCTKSTTQ